MVQLAAKQFKDINLLAEDLQARADEIVGSSKVQNQDVALVNESIRSLEQTSRSNVKSAQQIKDSVNSLEIQSARLSQAVLVLNTIIDGTPKKKRNHKRKKETTKGKTRKTLKPQKRYLT